MFSHFGLLQFWFTNEFSEAALLFFFVFFYEIFNFSSENWPNHWDMRWILLNLLVLSAEFNLTLSTKLGKVFSYNSWAVLDIPYSSLHLSNSPNIYWMPATESFGLKKLTVLTLVLDSPNTLLLFHQIPDFLCGYNWMLFAEFFLLVVSSHLAH